MGPAITTSRADQLPPHDRFIYPFGFMIGHKVREREAKCVTCVVIA